MSNSSAHQLRETELLKEVQALKATVFRLNQDGSIQSPTTSRIPVRRVRKNLPYGAKDSGTGEGSGQSGAEVEMISVPRLEYEALVKEVSEQETLIVGFQLENEKLSQQLRQREEQVRLFLYLFISSMYMYINFRLLVQENSRIAQHYDAQETLNKELNRLRNQSGNVEIQTSSFPSPYPLGGTAPGIVFIVFICVS